MSAIKINPNQIGYNAGGGTVNDGDLLIGSNSTGAFKIHSLTAGANIAITPGDGTISIAASAPGTGTVTSITAGSGLSGGTITTSGTIAIAALGVTTAMIAANAVTSAKVDSSVIIAAGTNAFTGDQSLGSHKITSLATGTADTDGVNVAQLNASVAALAAKNDVQAATVAALAAATYNNGSSGVGATLTLTVAAVLVLDGYTPALNDRLLIKNQADAKQNGLYTLTTLGTVLINAVLTRTLDFDQPGDGINGALVFVLQGTTNGHTLWYCTATANITFGTDNINFSQFTGTTYTADESTLHLSGTTFSIISTYTGQASITTLGTIATGVWQGTSIGTTYTAAKVTSVFTRTGAVTAQTGDYTAAKVTNAADVTTANTFTAAQEILINAVGTNLGGTASADGLIVFNSTAAANGAQQYSPCVSLTGMGWDTSLGSVEADWYAQCRPIQGHPVTSRLYFRSIINGTASDVAYLTSAGTFVTTAFSGDGSALTSLTGTNVTGTVPAATTAGTCSGNAATVTALATARAINGVNFDGTAAITVTAAAGTLTGTTLNATVVTSSLTSVGTLAGLTEIVSDAATSGTSTGAIFGHDTSGTAAAGFGSVYKFQLQDSTTADTDAANVTITWATATHASRKARVVHNVFDTATREGLRIEASGTAPMIGFLGASASAALASPDLGTLATTFGLATGTPTFGGANVTGTIASAQLPTGNWIGASSGAGTGSFTLTGTNGTYQDTGIAPISLPGAGTYLVLVNVRATLKISATTDAFIVVKLFNSTDSADVANSERLVVYQPVLNEQATVNASLIIPVTVTGAKTVKLYAARFNGTTYTTSTIDSDANGRTAMTWVRIY